jgi:hypothetical protein
MIEKKQLINAELLQLFFITIIRTQIYFPLLAAPAYATYYTYELSSFLTILALLVLRSQCISQILMHTSISIYYSDLLAYYTIFK